MPLPGSRWEVLGTSQGPSSLASCHLLLPQGRGIFTLFAARLLHPCSAPGSQTCFLPSPRSLFFPRAFSWSSVRLSGMSDIYALCSPRPLL